MISRLISRTVPYVTAAALAFTGMQAFGAIATIDAGQDNSIAQEFPTRSAGLCDSLFSGNTDNYDPGNSILTARRALLQFDLSSIPAGSIINSVTLNMTVTRGGNHIDSNFDLHPITLPWVEGTNSDCSFKGGGQLDPGTADGVTWNTQPTYDGTFSASTLVNTTTPSWSSAQMVTDVQDWLEGNKANYGWILIGDETTLTLARRFDSFQGGTPPQLVVDFALDPNADAEACCEANGDCSLTLVGSGTCGGVSQGVDTTCESNLCPQPSGACCNADRTCSDVPRNVCEGDGGTFVGGNCNQADCGLTPFVEALPIPPILPSDGTNAQGHPTYTVSVDEATQSVHPDLPDTTLWTYNGAWPSSTIVATKDEPIQVTYVNNLPDKGNARGSSIVEVDTCAHGPNDWGNAKRISTHLHGGHLPARFDGQPEFTILPGESDVYHYPNNQDAGTVWYHDHALGITRLNVYSGMAGFYLIRDDEDTLGLGDQTNALNLPNAAEGNEIGLAVQDRTFNVDGSLFYNAQLEDAFKGEYALVNGKVNPYLEVRQGKYRFRLLNGSQSREYIYRLENTSGVPSTTTGLVHPDFTLIGTDLGLVDAPRNLGNTTGTVVGPAERLDVVIDFAGYPVGTEIILKNDDMTEPLLPNIMKFIVTDQLGPGHTDPLPETLRAVTPLPDGSEDVTRYFRLAKSDPVACKDGSSRMINEWLIESLDGQDGDVTGKHWDDVTEYPVLGQREVWEFFNDTNSYHPMHVHLVKFQILSKSGPSGNIPLQPWEANAWKDIVHIPPNSTARIIMDFEDYPGRFPSHCHLLDHEDHEMMRQFQTVGGVCNINGTCDPGENCSSLYDSGCADCAQVSGALCGNGLCEAGDGENCANCADDCAGKQKGSQQNQFCCGFDDGDVTNSVECDQGNAENRCIDPAAGLACRVTARLPACCGDFMCEGQETISNCAVDCDPIDCTLSEPGTEVTCNDGEDNDCNGLTDAADPNCQVACVPDETPEQSCFDGDDNDCDTLTDCADLANCDGVADPARPTTCGLGVCASSGNIACSGGSEVDTCSPLPQGEPTEVTCDDGLDNDCDGLVDANDPDCPVACVPDETPEQSCFDGNDNDCDELVDCADTVDCEGAIGAPTTCGVGVCASTGNDTCSGGSQVDTCTPGTPGVEGPNGDASCNDGLDNDCDGLVDANDPDCQGGGVVCSDINKRKDCNNESACTWDQGSRTCVDA